MFSHHFTLGADIVVFGWLIYFVAETTLKDRVSHKWCKFGPLLLVILGSLLTVVDISRHVLLDHGGVICPPRKLSMFNLDGSLSAVGRFCQACTWIGLSFLIVGVIWLVEIPEKLIKICHNKGDSL